MYRANNTLVHVQCNTYCGSLATMWASMHITPINMSEDPCVIHSIVYSVCCPIAGAIHVDYDNMIVFNTFNTCCHLRCIALDNTY